jgi:hypothetical protein
MLPGGVLPLTVLEAIIRNNGKEYNAMIRCFMADHPQLAIEITRKATLDAAQYGYGNFRDMADPNRTAREAAIMSKLKDVIEDIANLGHAYNEYTPEVVKAQALFQEMRWEIKEGLGKDVGYYQVMGKNGVLQSKNTGCTNVNWMLKKRGYTTKPGSKLTVNGIQDVRHYEITNKTERDELWNICNPRFATRFAPEITEIAARLVAPQPEHLLIAQSALDLEKAYQGSTEYRYSAEAINLLMDVAADDNYEAPDYDPSEIPLE